MENIVYAKLKIGRKKRMKHLIVNLTGKYGVSDYAMDEIISKPNTFFDDFMYLDFLSKGIIQGNVANIKIIQDSFSKKYVTIKKASGRRSISSSIQLFSLFDDVFKNGGDFFILHRGEGLCDIVSSICNSYILNLCVNHGIAITDRVEYILVPFKSAIDEYCSAKSTNTKKKEDSTGTQPEETLKMVFDRFNKLEMRIEELERSIRQDLALNESKKTIEDLKAKAEAARKEADLYNHLWGEPNGKE